MIVGCHQVGHACKDIVHYSRAACTLRPVEPSLRYSISTLPAMACNSGVAWSQRLTWELVVQAKLCLSRHSNVSKTLAAVTCQQSVAAGKGKLTIGAQDQACKYCEWAAFQVRQGAHKFWVGECFSSRATARLAGLRNYLVEACMKLVAPAAVLEASAKVSGLCWTVAAAAASGAARLGGGCRKQGGILHGADIRLFSPQHWKRSQAAGR